jgi:hypothetical protein
MLVRPAHSPPVPHQTCRQKTDWFEKLGGLLWEVLVNLEFQTRIPEEDSQDFTDELSGLDKAASILASVSAGCVGDSGSDVVQNSVHKNSSSADRNTGAKWRVFMRVC